MNSKTVRNFQLYLGCFFFLTTAACAQESSPTDEIVVKAANAVIFEMTANLKLTQDQINAVTPIVTDNIVKTSDLQQSLEDGNIDSATMYSQRQQLVTDEDEQLGAVLTPDQMKTWMNMQDEEEPSNGSGRHSSSK